MTMSWPKQLYQRKVVVLPEKIITKPKILEKTPTIFYEIEKNRSYFRFKTIFDRVFNYFSVRFRLLVLYSLLYNALIIQF